LWLQDEPTFQNEPQYLMISYILLSDKVKREKEMWDKGEKEINE
jgi:hypothetical protein